jgi:hypothetical protein
MGANATTCQQAGLDGSKLLGADKWNEASSSQIVATTKDQKYLSYTIIGTGVHISGVVVKGGNGYNIYRSQTKNLRAPDNKGGNVPNLSHWFICGTTSTQPPTEPPSSESPTPVVAEPTFADPTCQRLNGLLIIPNVDGVDFYIDENTEPANPGSYPYQGGQHVSVRAELQNGYEWQGEATHEWDHDFTAAEGCSTRTPTPTPTKTRPSGGGGGETSSVTPSPSTEVLGEKATASPTPVVAGGKLPFTGASLGTKAALSAALLAGGALLLTLGRKRHVGTHR